jgi:YggT family protein
LKGGAQRLNSGAQRLNSGAQRLNSGARRLKSSARRLKSSAKRLETSAMEAIRYIVDTLLWLLTLAFVLRLLFQWVRADFRDPMADAIVRVTNWLILPLRRVLPPIRKIDTATVVAVLAVAAVRAFASLALSGVGVGDPLLFLRLTAVDLVGLVLRIYLFALLLYWLTSFVSPGGYAPGVRLLAQLCEPILKPVRRMIPPIGQIDFSVLWVSIAIGALLVLLR